jgi:Na+-translocating ferredoxin:NAD+ oxidoreductase RNF subunit RnfB
MPKRDLQPLQIHRMLPRTNCKQCGSAACYAFAFDLISHSKRPEDCPPLLTEEFAESYRMLKELLGEGERIKGTDHVLDKSRCTGCGDCVTICNKALTTITKGGRFAQRAPVPSPMKIVDGNLSVIQWSSCKRATRGLDICNLCAEKCPFSAIDLVKAEEESDEG